MKTLKNLFALGSACIILFSCQKESAPKTATAQVSYQFTPVKKTTSLAGTTQSTLVFNSGFIKIREIVFDAQNASTNQSVSFTTEKISTIDYATGVSSPQIIDTIAAGTYKSVNLGVEIYDEVNAPSIVIDGVYTQDDGTTIPVRFEFNSGEVFEANASLVTLAENTSAIAKIKFDPHYWFSAITNAELENAVLTNGVLLINEVKNASLFVKIADKLDDATQATF